MNVTIRKFEEKDIANKIKWINDERNNRFLHYDLPLSMKNFGLVQQEQRQI